MTDPAPTNATTTPAPLKRPSLIELDDAPAADPARAETIPDAAPTGRAMQTLARATTGRASPLTRARSRWAHVDLATRRPTPIDEGVRATLARSVRRAQG